MRLRFAESALVQLEDTLRYLAADDPAAAARLQQRLEQRLRHLLQHPQLGRVVPELGDGDRREVVVAPLRPIYRVVADELRILAVVHGRQDLPAHVPERRGRRPPARK